MSSPQSAPDVVVNNGESALAAKDNNASEDTPEDGATTTSTQPENSGGGSSNHSSINGEDGSDIKVAATPVESTVSTDAQTTNAAAVPVAPPSVAPSQTKTFVYDPNKITLKFIFANRDGLNVILDCTPADTVGEVKGSLLSLWPEDMPECSDGDRVRLICMGKGMLMPDSKSLESLNVPVFKTHATPVNVALRPEITEFCSKSPSKKNTGASPSARGGNNSDSATGAEASTGCSCVIL